MEVQGSHAVVTGGSRGLGRAIAEALNAAGARVSVVARSTESVAAAAEKWGGVGVGADLSTRGGTAGLIGRIEEAAGPVDLLVNNAGVETHQHLAELTAGDVEAVMVTNLLAPIELTRQALPGMLQRGRGHIVNVSSMAGAVGFPGLTTYSSSKAGLTAFSRTLRMDLRGQPVGVTSVEIGTVPTDMLADILAEDSYRPTKASFDRVAHLRLMTDVDKDDVAQAVVRAVEKGKRKVWLPRRAAAFPMMGEIPQAVSGVILAGVPKHGHS